MSDKLRRIPSMKLRQGWRSRSIYIALDNFHLGTENVFVSPAGVELVRVRNGEAPEFIVRFPGKGMPPVYLRRFKGSSAQRAYDRAQSQNMYALAWGLADKARERSVKRSKRG